MTDGQRIDYETSDDNWMAEVLIAECYVCYAYVIQKDFNGAITTTMRPKIMLEPTLEKPVLQFKKKFK